MSMNMETGTATFVPAWLPKEEADAAFAALRDMSGWERRADAPRSEFYCNDFGLPYTYGRGRGERTYHPQPWTPTLLDIRQRLEKLFSCAFEAVFLNAYRDASDQLGWHSDNSPEMDDARPICVVTVGAERDIAFRPMGEKTEKRVRLTHGSLLVMPPGYQDTHEHRIPKASFKCGQRISMTYRGWITPR